MHLQQRSGTPPPLSGTRLDRADRSAGRAATFAFPCLHYASNKRSVKVLARRHADRIHDQAQQVRHHGEQ